MKRASTWFPACAVLSALAAGAAVAGGGFTHEMPRATNEKPLVSSADEMAAVFANPFGKVETGCYWYWMAGNISHDGVKKDLEAMKRVGIERPYIGDIGGNGSSPGPVKTLTPAWHDVVQTAIATASRLEMSLGMFNSPGWSQSGGPWVKPEEAMRRFVSSSVVVQGPARRVRLPQPVFERVPAADARDVCVIAYPAPAGFSQRLEKRNGPSTPLSVHRGGPLTVDLTADAPFTAQGAEIVLARGALDGRVIVEVESAAADGSRTWRRVCETPFCRSRSMVNVGFESRAPILASFAPVTGTAFRLTVRPRGRASATFARVAVCRAPLIDRAFEKTLAKMFESPLPMWHEYQWPQQAPCAPGTAFDPAKAVVLTGRLSPDGLLDWDVPAGEWVIYRLAAAPTGTTNAPANPEATGYEVDKMSREHIATHFNAFLGDILSRTPPEHRKALRYAVLDSYEQGGQNYTDRFAEKFKASFGYDPLPYLPAFFGMTVADRRSTDGFLWDVRRFVADEVAYSYVGGLRKASNAKGLQTWLECYGHWGFPGEFLQYGGQSDCIGGEFWCEGSLGDIENRAASSCAHIYGRRQIWAEADTCGGAQFRRGPMSFKQRNDRFFAEGINSFILHVYIQQADERAPGRIAPFGNEFNRHNTWFEHFDLYTGYLKRCGWMLQQGLNVADVAYFIGEDAPKMTGVTDPRPPRGRQFDYINAEVLVETARVDANGRIVLPHGTAYEVLVLPKLETMRPKMIACLERLVTAGAFVLGPKPHRSPSLAGQPQSDAFVKETADRLWGEVDGRTVKAASRGKGTIAWNLSLEEAFRMRGSAPDIAYGGRGVLHYGHRALPGTDIYFVSNQSGGEIQSLDVSFRVTGRTPELWDAATGERRPATGWRVVDGRTVLPLSFARHESVFVVFPDKNTVRTASAAPARTATVALDGPWTVSFQSDGLHRGPKEPLVLDRLVNLSTLSDPAVKYYSGRLVYRTTFTAAKGNGPVTLELGDVSVTAKVKVNGQAAGGVCFAPYRLDITPFAVDGANTLEVEVCNLWVNRLVGDAGLKDRPTWTNFACCNSRTPLPPSGLIGPVRVTLAD
jgi:hypothetical protein